MGNGFVWIRTMPKEDASRPAQFVTNLFTAKTQRTQRKIFATKALRHKGIILVLVGWCLSG